MCSEHFLHFLLANCENIYLKWQIRHIGYLFFQWFNSLSNLLFTKSLNSVERGSRVLLMVGEHSPLRSGLLTRSRGLYFEANV